MGRKQNRKQRGDFFEKRGKQAGKKQKQGRIFGFPAAAPLSPPFGAAPPPASHHLPLLAVTPVNNKKKHAPLHGQEEQQQHHQRHCQVLEVKTKKERKEEELPVAVSIATTSATPEPPSYPITAPAQ